MFAEDASQRRARLWLAAWQADAVLAFAGETSLASETSAAQTGRCKFDGLRLQLPQTGDERVTDAAIAHCRAHWCYGGARFDVASLQPLQVILISLLEDARVESLAMQDRPALRSLWAPHFNAVTVDAADVSALLHRLARALFDPHSAETHSWITRVRDAFFSRRAQWRDAGWCRELGSRFGNELGQMRLQFDAKSWRVEPAYRDDHSGLWQDNADPDTPADTRALLWPDDNGEARAQREQFEPRGAAGAGESAHDARAEAVIAAVPEWDVARRLLRAGWVSVRSATAPQGDSARIEWLQRQYPATLAAVQFHIDVGAPTGRKTLRRRAQGDDIDIDAVVRLRSERGAGPTAPRVYRRQQRRLLPRALIMLLDVSLSTGRLLAPGISQLAAAGACVAGIAGQCARRGDAVAVYAFCSDGRDALYIDELQGWRDAADPLRLQRRLAGLQPRYSTRLGAALRHVGAQFDVQHGQFATRQLIVFTDADVSDIDCPDPHYLAGDALHATTALCAQGIDVAAVSLEAAEATACSTPAFGARGLALRLI